MQILGECPRETRVPDSSTKNDLPAAQQWTSLWPTIIPRSRTSDRSRRAGMLQCDENRRAAGRKTTGNGRSFFCAGIRHRVSLGHSPNICMTAAGHTLTPFQTAKWFDAGGLRLPFAVFEVMDTPQPFYIYYCLWNDRSTRQDREPHFCRFAEIV